MSKLACLVLALALLCFGAGASAHRPGSDGGTAKKDCGVIRDVSEFGDVGVGATRVKCRIARKVARGSVRGESFTRWRCSGQNTRFGHCHGRGVREGGIVHWYAAE